MVARPTGVATGATFVTNVVRGVFAMPSAERIVFARVAIERCLHAVLLAMTSLPSCGRTAQRLGRTTIST